MHLQRLDWTDATTDYDSDASTNIITWAAR